MRDETGVYNEEATRCFHSEAMTTNHIQVCPTCDTYVVTYGKQESAYREVLEELINVEEFDYANIVYRRQLERAERDLRKFVKY